jgi:hypothetical protein
MEVLNKNQRQTAIWRLVGLGMLILGINALIILGIHRAYGNIGSGTSDELKRQLQAAQANASGKGQNQTNKIKELEAKIKVMETEKVTIANDLKIMKTRNEFLEKDLTRCQMSAARPPSN